MSGLGRKLPKDSLAARFLLVAIGAVAAALVLSFALFALSRPAEIPIFSARWLVDQVASAAREAFAKPPSERSAFLLDLGDPPGLTLAWRETREQAPASPPSRIHAMAAQALRAALGEDARRVVIEGDTIGPDWRGPWWDHRRMMDDDRDDDRHERRTRERERRRDFPVPGPFVVAVEGRDGTWFTATAIHRHGHRLIVMAIWIVAIALAVGGLSWWAARRLTGPLDRLVAAAARLGIDRNAPAVPEEGPRELRAIAAAFNDMRGRVKAFVEERTGLVAAVSHDLRTPLTRLRLRAEAVADEAERRRILDDIAEMEAMIAATLDFAREDRRDEALQAVDVASLLQSLSDDRADAGDDVAYAGPDHATLSCRPTALRRAFANLIDNAVKYGARARVALAESPTDVTVTVVDTGPGIPKAEREAVFRPFYRLDASRSRETGGVGLGLSIARDIVRSHGGSIALEDAAPRGLLVRVILPKVATSGPSARR